MRLQYVAVVAAAALTSTADGLQVVPNSATSTSLRVPAAERYQPYVEGKTDRFLVSESKNETPMKAPTGYEFSTLQEEDNDMLQQDDDDYEDESKSSSSEGSSSDERWLGRKKKRKKSKKNKATETPTPAPTATPEGNATATPVPGTTPAPTTRTSAPTTKPPKVLKLSLPGLSGELAINQFGAVLCQMSSMAFH